MILHPRFRTLEGFADGELGERRRARVASHLRKCDRCRRRVMAIRKLARAVRTDRGPDLPAGGFERIRAEAAEGRDVLLPVSGVGAPAVPNDGSRVPGPLVRAAGLAALFAAVAAYLLLGTEEAEAGHSELLFDPARPRAGTEVTVAYRPGSRLAGREAVVLRARFRGEGSEPYRVLPVQRVARLRPDDEGWYRGEVSLPDSVVFAAFAVEDEEGERIDANQGRLWTLRVHDGEGRPLAEALREQVDDLLGRNWELAHETARRMTELYPDRPDAWTTRRFLDAALVDEAGADSLRRFYEAVFHRLHRRLEAGPEVPPRDVADMWYLAWTTTGSALGTEERPDTAGSPMGYWRERALAAEPDDERTLLVHTTYAVLEHYPDPAALSRELEAIWRRSSVPNLDLVRHGISAARRAGDEASLHRWWLRYGELHPRPGLSVGRALVGLELYREEGIRWLERELERLDAGGDRFRGLAETRSEHAREVAVRRGQVLVTLAEGLNAAGRPEEAARRLDAAAPSPWDPELLRRAADVRLALGDTAAALDVYARAAADPVAPSAFADTVRSRTGRHFDPDAWRHRVDRARPAVLRAVRAGLEDRPPVDGEARLKGLDGETRALEALTGGRVAVVTFWSRRCGPSLQQLPSLLPFAAEMERRGIGFLAVTDEAPSEELRSFLEERDLSGLPVWSDSHGELGRALNQWSTPEHFVLDSEGRIRFARGGSLDGVLRAAEVVRRGEAGAEARDAAGAGARDEAGEEAGGEAGEGAGGEAGESGPSPRRVEDEAAGRLAPAS